MITRYTSDTQRVQISSLCESWLEWHILFCGTPTILPRQKKLTKPGTNTIPTHCTKWLSAIIDLVRLDDQRLKQKQARFNRERFHASLPYSVAYSEVSLSAYCKFLRRNGWEGIVDHDNDDEDEKGQWNWSIPSLRLKYIPSDVTLIQR